MSDDVRSDRLAAQLGPGPLTEAAVTALRRRSAHRRDVATVTRLAPSSDRLDETWAYVEDLFVAGAANAAATHLLRWQQQHLSPRTTT